MLMTSSTVILQEIIDLCVQYGHLWHYTFNASKLAIIVRGESNRLREASRSKRVWRMGHGSIPEVDVYRHLGVSISVTGSVLPHVVCSMPSARSAFYSWTQIRLSPPPHFPEAILCLLLQYSGFWS